MAAFHSPRRRRDSRGAYTIKGIGINASAPTLGAAISKAQTIASRIQREIKRQDEIMALHISMIGSQSVLSTVEIHPDVIVTWGVSDRN